MQVSIRSIIAASPFQLPEPGLPSLARYRMLRSPQYAELCQLFEQRTANADRDRFLELAAKLELTFLP